MTVQAFRGVASVAGELVPVQPSAVHGLGCGGHAVGDVAASVVEPEGVLLDVAVQVLVAPVVVSMFPQGYDIQYRL